MRTERSLTLIEFVKRPNKQYVTPGSQAPPYPTGAARSTVCRHLNNRKNHSKGNGPNWVHGYILPTHTIFHEVYKKRVPGKPTHSPGTLRKLFYSNITATLILNSHTAFETRIVPIPDTLKSHTWTGHSISFTIRLFYLIYRRKAYMILTNIICCISVQQFKLRRFFL